jgi:Glycosyltransferase 61
VILATGVQRKLGREGACTSNSSRYPSAMTFEEVPDAERHSVTLPTQLAPRATTFTHSRRAIPQVAPDWPITPLPLSVVRLPKARVATECGAVFDQRGRLVRETLWGEDHWTSINPPVHLPAATHLTGTVASILSNWSHAYYHWMLECLPRIAVLAASGLEYDSLLVPEKLTLFHRESLSLVGVPEEKLVSFRGNNVEVDELLWVSPLANVGFPTPYLVEWMRIALGAPTSVPHRRLYIPRRGTRRVANERAVMKLLRPLGFETVETDALSVAQQIKVFSEARFVVGPHGGAFTNAVFSRELTAVEFYQAAHANGSMTGIMAAAGHEHFYLNCRRVPALTSTTHQQLWVNLKDLRVTLETLGLS